METKGIDMPSKEKCKSWKKMGYESKKDCTSYGKKKKKAITSKAKPDSIDYDYEPIPPYGPR